MSKSIGALFVLAAVAIIGVITFYSFHGDFWILPPKQKFERAWREDIQLLEKSHKLPAGWDQIREIKMKSDNSPAETWIENVNVPIAYNPQGKYRLEVFVIHWLEGERYGAVVQYDLVDLKKNNETVSEFSRTLKLGIVY